MPHDALPSERDLAEQFKVSRMTVRAAIGKLVSEGRVYNIQGSGTYVGSKDIFSKAPRLTSFTEDMAARGFTPSSKVISARRVAADRLVSQRLGIDEGDQCTHIRRLRLADGDPMAFEDVYIPATVLPLEDFQLSGSLYAQLAQAGYDVFRSEQEVTSVIVEGEEAAFLDVPTGSAALCVTRVSSTHHGKLVEFGRTHYRADRYSFRFAVTRESSER